MKKHWLDADSLVDLLPKLLNVDDEAKLISQDLTKKNIDISILVEKLGQALTSFDPELRRMATTLLAATLAHLPTEHLSSNQLLLIVAFFCDRSNDHHSVVPAVLTGMNAISIMTNLPNGSATKMVHALFKNITCQSQLREDRACFYQMLQTLSQKHGDELRKLRADFVYGVVSAMEGERDCRNLVFLFAFLPEFIRNFPLGHIAEEMFEVLACYFPVDFSPTQTDPKTVTRDQIATSLLNCLTANQDFGELCLALALDKLNSDLKMAKLDSLQLLERAADTFPSTLFEKYFETIWQTLRNQLLPGDEPDVLRAGSCALEGILRNTHDEEILDNILIVVFKSILPHLSDAKTRLFLPSTRIALLMANSGDRAASLVTEKILPVLLEQFYELKNGSILKTIAHLIDICRSSNVLSNVNQTQVHAAEMAFVDCLELPELLVTGIECLSKSCDIISTENRQKTFAKLLIILKTNSPATVSVSTCLTGFVAHFPDEVHNFVANIIDLELTEYSKPARVLRMLAQLIRLPTLTEVVLEYFIHNIFHPLNDETQLLALENLRIAIESSPSDFIQTIENRHTLISQLVDGVKKKLHLLTKALNEVSDIIKLIIRSLDTANQSEIVHKYLPTMNLQLVGDLYLTAGLLSQLEGSIDLDEHFLQLVNELSQLAIEKNDENLRKVCHYMICSLFNRQPDPQSHVLKKILIYLKTEIEKHNHQAIETLSWIAKGLLVKGDTAAVDVINDIADLLENSALNNFAVLAFEVLSIEVPSLHLPLVKSLYKQKLFQLVINKLIGKIEKLSFAHLTALAYIFQVTPHRVIKMNIEKVGPILLECFELDGERPQFIALDICQKFIKIKDEYVGQIIQVLVPIFLRLASGTMAMNTRIAALDCLAAMCGYPTFMVVPFKQDVVYGLLPALDDRKRLVRKAAVEARTTWFLLGAIDNT